MEEKKKSIWPIAIFVFIGCLLIGAGIGNAFDASDVGGSIGLGAGFLSVGVVLAYFKNK